jgi:hypothetical protein
MSHHEAKKVEEWCVVAKEHGKVYYDLVSNDE